MQETKPTLKEYDLEDRTYRFARAVRAFLTNIPNTLSNREDAKQLVRSSGSVGANFIEANEAFIAKDRMLRIKIVRKEAKESIYWLKLLNLNNNEAMNARRNELLDEANQLMKIMGSIIRQNEKT